MKKLLFILIPLSATLLTSTSAAAKEAFSCEKIKDKVVRTSCIEDRGGKKDAENISNVQKNAIKKFVADAKAFLVKDFKDPSSAQFTGLFVVETRIQSRYLCGVVNGKNSYGGYTGGRTFYVRDATDKFPMHSWMDSDTHRNMAGDREIAKLNCSGGDITPVE